MGSVLTLGIAGKRLRFHSESPLPKGLLGTFRELPFRVDDEGEADAEYHISDNLDDVDLGDAPRICDYWNLRVYDQGDQVVVQSPQMDIFTARDEQEINWYPQAILDANFRTGRMGYKRMNPEGLLGEVPLGPTFLREILVNTFAAWDMAMLHCSHVDIGGRSVIFSARSGTGKSTIAKNFQTCGHRILNDECNLLYFEDGVVTASTTPFVGEVSYTRPNMQSVAAICYLEQGDDNIMTRMDPVRGAIGLMRNAIAPRYHKANMEKTLGIYHEIAEAVPCFTLRNTPDFRAVQAVERMLEETG